MRRTPAVERTTLATLGIVHVF